MAPATVYDEVHNIKYSQNCSEPSQTVLDSCQLHHICAKELSVGAPFVNFFSHIQSLDRTQNDTLSKLERKKTHILFAPRDDPWVLFKIYLYLSIQKKKCSGKTIQIERRFFVNSRSGASLCHWGQAILTNFYKSYRKLLYTAPLTLLYTNSEDPDDSHGSWLRPWLILNTMWCTIWIT